jgi:putative ABC transport system permease protein
VGRLFRPIGRAFTSALLGLVHLAALALSPWRIGRLLRTVSLPRFHEHGLRTALTVLGIALGVAMLVSVVLVNRSILRSFADTLDDISGKADLEVTAAASFEEAALETVRAVPGVTHATPVVQETALMRLPQAPGERLLIIGVDFLGEDDEHFRRYDSTEMKAIKDDPIAFLNASTHVIVSRALADRFGLKLKDTLPLQTPTGVQSFQIWGFIEDEGVGRAFGGNVAVMYYQAMQVAFDKGTRIDRIDVAVDPSAGPDAIAARLRAALGPGYDAARPERRNTQVAQMLGGLNLALTMGSLVAILVGMFLIYNTMSISVVQRKRELGILRALGTTRRQILLLFTLEGGLLGCVGSALGVFLGLFLARGMLGVITASVNEIYLQVAATDVHVDPVLLLGSGVLGILGAVASAFIPAREATRVSAVETLRTGHAPKHVAPGLHRTDLLAVGLLLGAVLARSLPPVDGQPFGPYASTILILLAVALAMPRIIGLVHRALARPAERLFGVEARLANDNVPRDLRRATITSGALMVGVSLTVAFGCFLESFKVSTLTWVAQTVPADLFVTSGARFGGVKNIPMADTLRGDLAALPGVEEVDRIRLVNIVYRDLPIKLLSAGLEIFSKHSHMTFLQGDAETSVPAVQAGDVMVSENLARRFGLVVGDTLRLASPKGEKAYRLAGVILDYTSDQGTIIMDRATMIRDWDDARVDTYELYLTPGTNPEVVKREIEARWGEALNLYVLTARDFRGELEKVLDQTFAVMSALELVALIIAVLGVVNALLATVIDRIRELGVLRAIGMLRRQVRRMVMLEAGILGVSAVIGGLLAGLALAWVLTNDIFLAQSGWYIALLVPVLPMVQLTVAVIGVSTLAGWYPARAAARLVVSDALEYE